MYIDCLTRRLDLNRCETLSASERKSGFQSESKTELKDTIVSEKNITMDNEV